MLPTMFPGASGAVFTFTVIMEGDEVPQKFVAVTSTFPPTELAVVVIELFVDAPFHPDGKDQL